VDVSLEIGLESLPIVSWRIQATTEGRCEGWKFSGASSGGGEKDLQMRLFSFLSRSVLAETFGAIATASKRHVSDA
jgi:hypothetical protein